MAAEAAAAAARVKQYVPVVQHEVVEADGLQAAGYDGVCHGLQLLLIAVVGAAGADDAPGGEPARWGGGVRERRR